ncbi:hypothetical protein [Microcoleus anatoxicus]|uniref:Uncharacterized protein n=1 Tax=Microcoleus anatoxicus PTRS2 TaxID=2705321 RepID=A0ABU8YTQ2_9CYAN
MLKLANRKSVRVHLNLVRAKHSGRQFISNRQRFTAGMLRPYEYIYLQKLRCTYLS